MFQACTLPDEYSVVEKNRTVLNDRINGELEKLIGKLKPLSKLCEDEEEKQSKGEDSLITLCNVLKCAMKPLPLKVAQYVSQIVRTELHECIVHI